MSRARPARYLIALLALFAAGPVQGAVGDKEEGQAIALRWCVTCHQVSPEGVASDAAPAFPSIAKNPAYTDARLRGWLSDPHPPMPKLQLSRQEIDDLVAYLRSLHPK